MTDLPAPSAQRLRRPSWRDSRLLIGLALVLLSTGLGAAAMARADHRVPVYAAKGPIVPGQDVGPEDVVRVDVQLAESTVGYVSAAAAFPSDAWALRDVRAGELIPVTAIGARTDVDVQPVALVVDATSASVLTVGSVVDVWVNRPEKGKATGLPTYVGPERSLQSVSVIRVAGDDGVLGGAADTRAVHVMVPRDSVEQVVADVDLGARITLVPVPGSVRRAES